MTADHLKAVIQVNKIVRCTNHHLKKLEECKEWPDNLENSDETIATLIHITHSLRVLHTRFMMELHEFDLAEQIFEMGKKFAKKATQMQQDYDEAFKDKLSQYKTYHLALLKYKIYFQATYFEYENDQTFAKRGLTVFNLIYKPLLELQLLKNPQFENLIADFEKSAKEYSKNMSSIHAAIKFNLAANTFHTKKNLPVDNIILQLKQAIALFTNNGANKQAKLCQNFLDTVQEPANQFSIIISQPDEEKISSNSSSTANIVKITQTEDSLVPKKDRAIYEFQIYCSLFKMSFYDPFNKPYSNDYSKITHYIGFDLDKTLIKYDRYSLNYKTELLEFLKRNPDTCLMDIITARADIPANRSFITNILMQLEVEVGRRCFRYVIFAGNQSKEFALEYVHEVTLPHLPKNKLCMVDDQTGYIYQCIKAGFVGILVLQNQIFPTHFNLLKKFLGLEVVANELEQSDTVNNISLQVHAIK